MIQETEEANLLSVEKAIHRFSEGKLWPQEYLSGLRQGWISSFKESKMDERLALRILQERIQVYMSEQQKIRDRVKKAQATRKAK